MNRYHLRLFDYTEEECLDQSPLFFIDSRYHQVILEAIAEIRTSGEVKQVYANIVTKAGESIPFLFEGYMVMIGKDEYFTGLGLNASELITAKQRLSLLELEQENIIREKELKERELMTLAFKDTQSEILLGRISRQLQTINEQTVSEEIQRTLTAISEEIRNHVKYRDGWSHFREAFMAIHHDFFSVLASKHPGLTEMEIRFCAYLKIKMAATDICLLLNISKEGLKKKRYRVRQKLSLRTGQSLEGYISSI